MGAFTLYITLTLGGNTTINTTFYPDRQSCITAISRLKNTNKELRTHAIFSCIKQNNQWRYQLTHNVLGEIYVKYR